MKQQLLEDLDTLLERLEIDFNKKEEIIFTVNQYIQRGELEMKNKL